MRKIFILSLLMAFIFATSAFAATKARTASVAQGIEEVVGIGDLSSGNTTEVDSNGNLNVTSGAATIAASTGATLNEGTALVSSACNVQSITISGVETSAGDYALIYDAASATGTPKFEVSTASAKGTVTIPCYGASFSTGVFADSNADAVHVAVVYN